ncbi:uncharacterized protein LOC141527470 [Cotesia typhae]|uniref:uncharacterized protein LOC141527470 n=1 Tax=Cotesia typhae TaxID=2053667 RepID=UPI003D68D1B9
MNQQIKKQNIISLSTDNYNNRNTSVITSTPNEPLPLPKLNIRLSEVQYPQEIVKDLFNQEYHHNSNTSITADNNDSSCNPNETESTVPSGAFTVAKIIGDSWLKDSGELDVEGDGSNNDNENEMSGRFRNSFDNNEIEKTPEASQQPSDLGINGSYSNQVETQSEVIDNENEMFGGFRDNFDDDKIERTPEAFQNFSDPNVNGSFGNQVDTQSEVIRTIEISSVIDNSKNDPNYSQGTSLTNNDTLATSFEATKSPSKLDDKSTLFEVAPSVDIRNLKILCSKKNKRQKSTKIYFCPYCKTVQTKFARHLELKHRDHENVKKMMYFSKGTKQRKEIIASIRNEGTFMHNVNKEYNTGHLMVARRRQSGKKFKKK